MTILERVVALVALSANVSAAQGWDNERPSWTPDDNIVFSSNRGGNWDLFVMDSEGGAQRALTNTDGDELFPAVSPDGAEVAFVMSLDGNYDVHVLRLSDGATRRLTQDPAIDDWPSWYAGGEQIVFDSERSGNWGVYAMSIDGSQQTLLIDHPGRDIDPHATPDHAWIVFSREHDDDRQIYAYRPDTNVEVQLTRNDRTNGHPALSPDGKTVVYNSGTDFWDLYVVAVDGGDERVIVEGDYDDRWGAWSPDGTKIAFESNRHGKWDVYVVDAKTAVQTRLTRGADARP